MSLRAILKYVLGAFFVLAGANHVRNPAFYVAIMPPYIPFHLALVYVSGLLEAALGLMLLVPRTKRLAAWGLMLLLVAIFPANVQMALHPELYPRTSAVLLWARLPLQGVLLAWAYGYTRPGAPRLERP